ncbi:MAG: hypothetical protein JXA83_07605 [Acidimicrobiales bacterium]|nr:hypothetical protein [Acidimicrobiales bacterium]
MATQRSLRATRPAPPAADRSAVAGVPSRPAGDHTARVPQPRASEGVADLASPLAGHALAHHLAPVHDVLHPGPDG